MSDQQYIQDRVEELKKKLLDLTKRNKLISFKHRAGAKDHIRIIDEDINFLYSELISGKTLEFKPLPSDEEIPKDEQTEEFQLFYSDFKSQDEEYLKAIEKLSEKDLSQEEYSTKLDEIELNLINKVREYLDLPRRKKQGNDNKLIAEMHNLNASFEMPMSQQEYQEQKHTDKYIQVLLKSKEMNACLSGLYDYTNIDQKDSGINSCYMSVGFLRWFDVESSDDTIDSPLLLIPLNISKQRTSKGPKYTISSTTDGIEVNLALKEKFKREFEIEIPDIEEDQTPEDYIQKLKLSISKLKPKWSIKRFITIGRLIYSKSVMFKDLESNAVLDNKLLEKLFSGSEYSSSHQHDVYNIDEIEKTKDIPELIYDADSSQMSSIIDALDGESMVIQGPPGTGKSQTIANLIASAIERNKKVLFVAEKMAALEVVHNRLQRKDLDKFCLELHSNKVGTPSVISSLARRLGSFDDYDSIQSKRKYEEKLVKMKSTKQALNSYYFNMNNIYSEIKLPLKDILGRKDKAVKKLLKNDVLASFIDNFMDSVIVEGVNTITDADYRDLNDSIINFSDKFKKLDIFNKNLIGLIYQERSPLEVTKRFKSVKQLNSQSSAMIDNLSEIFSRDSMMKVSFSVIDQAESKLKEAQELSSNISSEYIDKLKSKSDLWEDVLELASYHNRFMSSIKISDNLLDDVNFLNSSFTRYGLKTIDDFRTRHDRLKGFYSQLQEKQGTIKDIASVFSSQELIVEDLAKYLNFLNLLQCTDLKLLKLRSESVLDFDNYDLLNNALNIQNEIKELEDVLSEKFNIEGVCKNKNELITSIAYVTSKLKQNKLKLITFMKHKNNIMSYAKVKYKDLPMAELDKYLRLNVKLESDSEVKNIISVELTKETKLCDYIALNSWYKKVYNSFSGLNGVNKQIREFIKTCDINELKDVNQIFVDLQLLEVLSIFNSTEVKNIAKDIDVGDYLININQEIDGLSKVIQAYDNVIIDSNYDIEELSNNFIDVQTYYDLYKKLLSEIQDNVDISGMENTVNYLKIVFSLGLKSEILDRLLTSSKQQDLECLQIKIKNVIAIKEEVLPQLKEMLSSKVVSLEYFKADLIPTSNIVMISEKLRYIAESDSRFEEVSNFNHELSKLNNTSAKLSVDYLLKNHIKLELWRDFYDLSIVNSLLGLICQEKQSLTIYKGIDLDQKVQSFKYLDGKIQNLQSEIIKAKLLENTNKCFKAGNNRGSKRTWTESSLVNDIIKQKKPRVKVRDLMSRASQTIQGLKSCFMMSPLSVAQYLPRDIEFDLLIIDEASQMRVEDAIGSIIRAKQIIIVGDDKQLPPTSFFSGNVEVEEEDEIEEESILDLAKGKFNKSALLRWHYRSEHDSLIRYSNYKFYDGKLIAAPSPNVDSSLGLMVKNIEGIYSNNKNLDEIKSIINEVKEHIYNNFKHSLGVVAVNKQQAEALRDHIESTLQTDKKYIEFCNHWQEQGEPIFFKNLENVQGDERDVIFISTVYGKEEGQSSVRQNFGPINKKGGERRLNVLFTRSKKRMVIFTSLKPEDIKSESYGAQALKGFLEYANTKRIEQGIITGKAADSDFEISVMDRLKKSGFIVEPQVGVSGFRLDIGIKHEKYPYGFLCGIECDGATYHSSRSARDRDILRQSILESKGWKIFRVWSTDWFYSSDNAYAKLEKQIFEFLDEKLIENKERQNEFLVEGEHTQIPEEIIVHDSVEDLVIN